MIKGVAIQYLTAQLLLRAGLYRFLNRIRIVVVPVAHLDSLELYDRGDGLLKAAPFLREAHSARP